MKSTIQTSAEYLSNLCLESAQEYHEYTDKDLENATLIFSHFLLDVIYRVNIGKISKEAMEDLAETTGKAIRELIRMTTDLDMHEIVKRKN